MSAQPKQPAPSEKHAPRFELGRTVLVPLEVAETKQARVVGVEWGPGNVFVRHKATGWLYTLAFVPVDGFPTNDRGWLIPSSQGFLASEEEIERWQQSAKTGTG